MNNYAKLNKFQQHGPEDMGLYSALMIFGQLAAFLGGALYEPLLGRRSLYFVLAAALVAANLSFAWTDIRPALAAMALLTGFVLAAAFQSGMVAVTAYFRPVRRGTMFYEFLIGLTGLTSLLGGFLVEVGGAWGCGQVTALRLPMLAMSLCVLLGLAVQLLLVGRRVERRLLLPAARS
jgi:MFS family permease